MEQFPDILFYDCYHTFHFHGHPLIYAVLPKEEVDIVVAHYGQEEGSGHVKIPEILLIKSTMQLIYERYFANYRLTSPSPC